MEWNLSGVVGNTEVVVNPRWLTATTEYAYVRFSRLPTVHDVELVTHCPPPQSEAGVPGAQVAPVGRTVAIYEAIGDPPLSLGAVQFIVALYADCGGTSATSDPETLVGAPGEFVMEGVPKLE